LTEFGRLLEISRGWGDSKAKILKGKYEANLEPLKGGGVKAKKKKETPEGWGRGIYFPKQHNFVLCFPKQFQPAFNKDPWHRKWGREVHWRLWDGVPESIRDFKQSL